MPLQGCPSRRGLPCSLWRPQRRPDGAGEECARARGGGGGRRRSPSPTALPSPPASGALPLLGSAARPRLLCASGGAVGGGRAAQRRARGAPSPPARPSPPVQDERLEQLHRQPDGRRHLPGRRHRGLQGRALRLGRRARQVLRQHHAGGSERPTGEGAQRPFCERADAGRPEVLGDPGQPAHGWRVHHGPADQEHGRSPHLQHHCCHDQQDDSPGDGQGGRARRRRQQEVLRDGQPLAAITVLMRPPCSACGTTDGNGCKDVQGGCDCPGATGLAIVGPTPALDRHRFQPSSLPRFLSFFLTPPPRHPCTPPPPPPLLAIFSITNPYCCQTF